LVTHSLEQYEALAFRLATEGPLLREYHMRLESNRASYPLFNSDRFRRHIEAAYVTMWRFGSVASAREVSPCPREANNLSLPGARGASVLNRERARAGNSLEVKRAGGSSR
jgi:hypothetical protein